MKAISIVATLVSLTIGCGTEDLSADATEVASTESALSIPSCRDLLNNTHPIPTVRSVQVVSDLAVQSGGAATSVEAFAVNGDTRWAPFTTCVGIFDAGLTSDPSTGGTLQLGAIYTQAQFPSATTANVSINPSGLPAGAYWLRMVTRLADGTNDAAEGTLLVH